MNARPSLLLGLPFLLVGLALAGPNQVARKRTLRGQKALLEDAGAHQAKDHVLVDLDGWVENLTEASPSAPERVRCVQVDLDAKGEEAAAAPVTKNVPWRGLRFPARGTSDPCLDLKEVRVELRLVTPAGAPVEALGTGTIVQLRIGTRVYPGLRWLAAAIEAMDSTTPIILKVAPNVPARHVVTVLAIVCNAKRPLGLGGRELGAKLPRYTKIRASFKGAVEGAAKDAKGGLLVGVRVRPDARTPWSAVQAVFVYALELGITRVTLAANAGDLEIDLFQALGKDAVMRRGVHSREYDEKLKRDPKAGEGEIKKPLIIREQEVEAKPAKKGEKAPEPRKHR